MVTIRTERKQNWHWGKKIECSKEKERVENQKRKGEERNGCNRKGIRSRIGLRKEKVRKGKQSGKNRKENECGGEVKVSRTGKE